MDDKELEELIQKDKQMDMAELQSLLKKIEAGEKTTKNYYEAFELYDTLNKDNIYKQETENFAQLTMQAAEQDIEANNNVAESYEILAIIYQYKKDKEKMFRCINKAIELEPDNADYYLLRAEFYKNLRQKDNAEKDYNKACELDPSNIEIVKLLNDADKSISEAKRLVFLVYLLMAFVIFVIVVSIMGII